MEETLTPDLIVDSNVLFGTRTINTFWKDNMEQEVNYLLLTTSYKKKIQK